MNVYQRLKKDHDTVSRLFERIERTSTGDRRAREELFSALRAELLAHLQAGQEVFYSTLLQRIEDQDPLLEAFEEHALVERLLRDVETCAADEERWQAKVFLLKDLVQYHVEEEEGEIFEMARAHLAKEEADELGDRLLARKLEIA